MLEKKVMDALLKVMDPELRENVVDLKIVSDIKVSEGQGIVSCVFRPTVPTCPIGVFLAGKVKNAIAGVEGVKKIDIEIKDFFMEREAREYIESLDV